MAVTSSRRIVTIPDIPTVAETLPGFEVVSWQAIFGPDGVPPAIVARLHTEITKILAAPEMQERLAKLGMLPSTISPAQLATFQKAEVTKWAQVIQVAGIRLE